MNRVDDILHYFDPERFVEICRKHFDDLRTQIVANLQTETSTSGSSVNSLGVPEWTTGKTAASLQTYVEKDNDGIDVSFVGRNGITGIDKGYSPSEVHAQYSSFDSFLLAIERWAQAKEGMYGIGDIDAYSVAANVWSKGTTLYREGGGTEIMLSLLQPTVDNIEKSLYDMLDRSIYNMLTTILPDNGTI